MGGLEVTRRGERHASSPRDRDQRSILLDLARGLAALTVFLSHLRGYSFVEYGALHELDRSPVVAVVFGLTRLGHEAVLIFFVLSGYFVGGAILRRTMAGTFDLNEYSIDRVTRIVWPLAPAVLLTFALSFVTSDKIPSVSVVIGNMVGLNGVLTTTIEGNPALWSLAYEIWFYVVAGAAAFAVARQGLARVLAIVALAVSVAVFCVLDARYLAFWCIGAAAIYLVDSKSKGLLGLIGLAVMVLGIAAYQLGTASKSFQGQVVMPAPLAEMLVCTGFALIIPYLIAASRLVGGGWFSRGSAWLSDISYSLYLFHYPMLVALSTLWPRRDTLSVQALSICLTKAAITLALCILLHHLFEKQTPRLRTAWKQWAAKR